MYLIFHWWDEKDLQDGLWMKQGLVDLKVQPIVNYVDIAEKIYKLKVKIPDFH